MDIIINKKFWYNRTTVKRDMCHKEKLLENLRPITRLGLEVVVLYEKTRYYWNDSSFSEIEKFVKWHLLISCPTMDAESFARLLEKKLDFDTLEVEGQAVRISFVPEKRKISKIPPIAESKVFVVVEEEKKSRSEIDSLHIEYLLKRRGDETGSEYAKRMKELNKSIVPIQGKERIMYQWRTRTVLDYSEPDTSRKNYDLESGLIG